MRLLTDIETRKLFQIYLLERDNFPKFKPTRHRKGLSRYNAMYKPNIKKGLVGCLDANKVAKMKLTKRQKLALKAREKLILHNQGLIHKYAEKYTGYFHMYDDLVSYGLFGLICAVDTYDPSYNCLLSTHATWKIRQQLYHAVVNYLRIIKLDSDTTEDIRSVTQAVEQCRKSNKIVTVKNICNILTNEGIIDKSKIYDRVQRILLVSQDPLYFSMGGSEEDEYEFDPPTIDTTQSNIPYEYTELAKELLMSVTKDKESWCYELLCEYFGLTYGYKTSPQQLMVDYNITQVELDDLVHTTVEAIDFLQLSKINL